MYTVYYRKADGQGTKVFLSRLNRAAAQAAQEHHFKTQPDVTMCWVLDENNQMLGDPLDRDPPEDETTRIARAT